MMNQYKSPFFLSADTICVVHQHADSCQCHRLCTPAEGGTTAPCWSPAMGMALTCLTMTFPSHALCYLLWREGPGLMGAHLPVSERCSRLILAQFCTLSVVCSFIMHSRRSWQHWFGRIGAVLWRTTASCYCNRALK